MGERDIIRILVLEDDEQDFRILERHLKTVANSPYVITRVETVDAARFAIADNDFNVALVDYRLEDGHSGIDFIAELGGREAPFPSILMTGMDTRDLDREAVFRGAYDYIDKLALTRDLVDRSIRFAIKSHEYEQRLRSSVAEATEQASINRNILSIVSHEMKSPISSIVGYCEYLIENAPSDTTRDAATKMKAASTHLEDFLRNLSEFVRLDGGGAEIVKQDFHLKSMLEETVAFFQPYARHKAITLKMMSDASIDQIIAGDRLRMRQVLINLLKNAVNYTDCGAVSVYAKIKDSRLQVFVEDEGVGIAEHKVAAILADEIKPQAPGAALDGGLGLGLSIVRRLLALMGGRFLLESEVGIGTRAGFEIPLDEVAQSAAA